MTLRTTTEMIAAIQRAHAGIKSVLSELQPAVDRRAIFDFGMAMLHGGSGPAVAEEHRESLGHAMLMVEEALQDAMRHLGGAEHIVSAGVHKTPAKGGRNHLVL